MSFNLVTTQRRQAKTFAGHLKFEKYILASPFLSTLFNHCLLDANFLSSWKCAQIIPPPFDSYTSILSIFAKIWSRPTIGEHRNRNNFMPSFQLVFQKGSKRKQKFNVNFTPIWLESKRAQFYRRLFSHFCSEYPKTDSHAQPSQKRLLLHRLYHRILKSLTDISSINQLALNMHKCQTIVPKTKVKTPPEMFSDIRNLSWIHMSPIQTVNQVVYLGIPINTSLSNILHISNALNRASK